jgi:hypothetical protein
MGPGRTESVHLAAGARRCGTPVERATMRVMRALVVALSLGSMVTLGGCLLGEAGCPCGSDPSDPLREHDTAFSGVHVVDRQCVCTCGEDGPTSYPADRACSAYEGPCEDADGERAERRCR